MQQTEDMQVWSLDWENPLEEEVATHSCVPAGKIPWTEEPGGPQAMGHKRGRCDLATKQQQQNCPCSKIKYSVLLESG